MMLRLAYILVVVVHVCSTHNSTWARLHKHLMRNYDKRRVQIQGGLTFSEMKKFCKKNILKKSFEKKMSICFRVPMDSDGRAVNVTIQMWPYDILFVVRFF
jgi:hypothetical protein